MELRSRGPQKETTIPLAKRQNHDGRLPPQVVYRRLEPISPNRLVKPVKLSGTNRFMQKDVFNLMRILFLMGIFGN
ncbi:hypothetical protein BHE74_00030756 [Ensete ventricosum]|nr:hypothetical protein GW17_00023225 [Ensete ventricosum]RWW62131.1 hypothetical protein BHE74_00030756 [Ensete ventricosum]RZR82810.1 hypothetical protein BHM03_00009324 [Ensete ventricosum]